LFGDENEELQKVLVQVQGSMALLNGVTEITNLLQAESQIMIKANAIALGIYNGILRITGTTAATATISLRAFKIALATTGIGALVVGIAYLVEAMNKASKATKDATKAREDFESTKSNSETRLKQFDNETTIIVNNLKLRNASELEIAKTIAERIRLRNVETQQIVNQNAQRIEELRGSVKEHQKAIDDKKQAQIKFNEWEKTYGPARDEFLRQGGARGGGGMQYRNPNTDAANADVSESVKLVGQVTDEIKKLQDENTILKQQMTILTQEGKLGIQTAVKNASKDVNKTAEDNLKSVREFIEEAKRLIRDANQLEEQKELNAIDDKYEAIGKKVIAGSDEEKKLLILKEQEKAAVVQKYKKQLNDKYIEFLKDENLKLQKAGKTQEEQDIIDIESQFQELLNAFAKGSEQRIALEKLLQERILSIRREYAKKQEEQNEDNLEKQRDAFGKWMDETLKGIKDFQEKAQANTFDLIERGTTSVFGAIEDVITGSAGKSEAAQRKAFNQNKKFAIAETIISTYAASQKAYYSQLNLLPDSPIRAKIAAALAIVSGLGRVIKISKTQFDSSSFDSSDSGTGSVSGGFSGMSQPQFGGGPTNPNGSLGNLSNPNNNNTQNNNNNNQSETQPIRAYVVERDITQTNTRIQRLQEFATLGN